MQVTSFTETRHCPSLRVTRHPDLYCLTKIQTRNARIDFDYSVGSILVNDLFDLFLLQPKSGTPEIFGAPPPDWSPLTEVRKHRSE